MEEIGDDHVFHRVVNALDPVRLGGVEEAAESKVKGDDHGLDQGAFRGQERGRASRLEGVSRPKPVDQDAEAVRVVGHLVVILEDAPVPLNEAAVAARLKDGVGEEVLQAPPQEHLVEPDHLGDRAQLSVDGGRPLLNHR